MLKDERQTFNPYVLSSIRIPLSTNEKTPRSRSRGLWNFIQATGPTIERAFFQGPEGLGEAAKVEGSAAYLVVFNRLDQ